MRFYMTAGFGSTGIHILLGEIEVLELLTYVVHVVHGPGDARVFSPEQYLSAGGERDLVVSRGKDLVRSCSAG